ncbi:MAG: response regulator [Beijerinckiaceae bacterium]|nr:response regulator [Beijerinckiaceae bacterium]
MSCSASAFPVILVVEDEVFIRFDVADMLRDGGFEVIEACDAKHALDALKSGVRIDLVFSDVHMPGPMNGLGLASHILENHPGLPVILTSGAMLTLETAALPSVLIPVEPKPYDFNAILKRINGALGL